MHELVIDVEREQLDHQKARREEIPGGGHGFADPSE